MDVKGKTVFVTGGNTGMGKAIVKDFAARGANICVGMHKHHNDEALALVEELNANGTKAKAYQIDISDEQNVIDVMKQIKEDFGGLSALVNSAAVTYQIPMADLDAMTAEKFDKIMNVNIKGTFFCCREAQRIMDEGVIVNITSTAGLNGLGSCMAYAASKAAIINMTRSLARALAPRIRVLSVAPGLVETNFTANMPQERFGANAEQTLIQRLVLPEEVAQVVGMLVYDNDILSGINVVADGGRVF